MARIVIPPKTVADRVKVVFDFISLLGLGETISTQTVTATTYSGIDANPSAIVSGAASASGTKVTQLIINGVVGTIYQLVCTITTSASQTLTLSGYLVIESSVP